MQTAREGAVGAHQKLWVHEVGLLGGAIVCFQVDGHTQEKGVQHGREQRQDAVRHEGGEEGGQEQGRRPQLQRAAVVEGHQPPEDSEAHHQHLGRREGAACEQAVVREPPCAPPRTRVAVRGPRCQDHGG